MDYKTNKNNIIMKKSILSLIAIMAIGFYANQIKAQEDDSNLKFNATLPQGSGGWYKNYICIVSKEQAKELKDVMFAEKDHDKILDLLYNELDNVYKKNKIYTNDTIYIQADSVVLEKELEEIDDEMFDVRTVIVYDGEHNYSHSSAQVKDYVKLVAADVVYEILSHIYPNLNNKKPILKTNFAFGYSYLNWSNKDFFSTPSGNDPYSLKWSSRWDILWNCTLFPEHTVSITTGVGYQSNIFNFENGFYNYDFPTTPQTNNYSIEESKLVARYVTVPLLVNFKLHKKIRLHIGAIGGINYRCAHTGFKRSFIQNGELTEQYTGSAFNEFNTFKADAMFGIELDKTTFYVTHALVDMFKDSYKYSAKPFSFGIMIGL